VEDSLSRTLTQQEFLDLTGTDLGTSDWLAVSQERIQQFADATDDHQFIHIDPERAAATPFGSTIAHGFLTLSLLPHLSEKLMPVPEGLQMGINYGLNKVRFLQPVKSGSEVRLHMTVTDVVEKGEGKILLTTASKLEIRGEETPAYIAEMMALFIVG